MAYDEPGYGLLPKPKKPKLPGVGGVKIPGFGTIPDAGPVPLPQIITNPGPPPLDWTALLQQDPGYLQEVADIGGVSASDRQGVLAALRSALARFGGNLSETLAGAGLPAGWEDLVDQATLGTAGAADTSGTSISSQLDKAHQQRLLAEEDIRAAKGILSSGQSGYEIGEARQANTINRTNAVNALLDFLRGGIGGFTTREGERTMAKNAALDRAAQRVRDSGLMPPPPADPLSIANAIRNATSRKARRRTGLAE